MYYTLFTFTIMIISSITLGWILCIHFNYDKKKYSLQEKLIQELKRSNDLLEKEREMLNDLKKSDK